MQHTCARDVTSGSIDVVEEHSIGLSKYKGFDRKVSKVKEEPIPEICIDEDIESPEYRRFKGKPLKDYPDVKKSFTLDDSK